MPDLIVNADDLGRTAGINRGILEAHKKGIVTSATVMVNYPAAEDGIALMLAEAPFLGMGLHLNLTSGRPVSDPETVPSLLDENGLFRQPRNWGPVMTAFAPEEVERELRAQMARFIELAGKPPTHLDSHHHAVYGVPAGLTTMLAMAEEYDIPIRRPPFEERAMDTANLWLFDGLAPTQARGIAEQLHGILANHPDLRMPARFVTSFYAEKAILGELLVVLTTLSEEGVTELMCHPGYAEGLDSSYCDERETELKWLTYPSTHEVIVAEDIRLVTFAGVGG